MKVVKRDGKIVDFDDTRIINAIHKANGDVEEKDYNPTDQLVGYLISGDPSYITSYNNARTLIKGIDRDELIAEMLKEYIAK